MNDDTATTRLLPPPVGFKVMPIPSEFVNEFENAGQFFPPVNQNWLFFPTLVNSKFYSILALLWVAIAIVIAAAELSKISFWFDVALLLGSTILFLCELTRIDLRIVKLLIVRWEFWYLWFNVVEHITFIILAKSEGRSYSERFSTWTGSILWFMYAHIVLLLDAAMAAKPGLKLGLLIMFVVNNLRVIVGDRIARSYDALELCLTVCSDTRQQALSTISVATAFALKYIWRLRMSFFMKNTRFAMLTMPFSVKMLDGGLRYSLKPMLEPALSDLQDVKEFDFLPINTSQTMLRLSKRLPYHIYAVATCLMYAALASIRRFDVVDSALLRILFGVVIGLIMVVFIIELTRFDRKLSIEALWTFDFLYLEASLATYCLFTVVSQFERFDKFCLLATEGLVLVLGTFSFLLDATRHGRWLKAAFLSVFVITSIRILVMDQLSSMRSPATEFKIWIFTSDSRSIALAAMSNLGLFWLKYLAVTVWPNFGVREQHPEDAHDTAEGRPNGTRVADNRRYLSWPEAMQCLTLAVELAYQNVEGLVSSTSGSATVNYRRLRPQVADL